MTLILKRLFLLVPLCLALACGEEEGKGGGSPGGGTTPPGSGGGFDWGIGGGQTDTQPAPKPGEGKDPGGDNGPGDGPGGPGGPGDERPPDPPAVEAIEVLEFALDLRAEAEAFPAYLAAYAADLAIISAIVSNASTMLESGTLRAPEVNGGEWGYSPSPADRLIYVSKEGQTSFRFVRFFGHASRNGDEFIEQDHDVEVVVEGSWGRVTGASVKSSNDGIEERVRVDGNTTDGCTWRHDGTYELSSSTAYGTLYGSSTRVSSGDVRCGNERTTWNDQTEWEHGQGGSNYFDETIRNFSWNWSSGQKSWSIPDGEVSMFKKVHGVTGYFPKGTVLEGGQPVGGIVTETTASNEDANLVRAFVEVGGKRLEFGQALVKK